MSSQTIYEWDQTLDEVNLYTKPPPGFTAKMVDCKITSTKLTLGFKGKPPFINEELYLPVKSKDSLWMKAKMNRGEIWLGALKAHVTEDSSVEQEKTKQQLMLQRFQEENPGFDFSGAEFSGSAPDPRSFMGGMNL
ncbi:putative nuclear movement domain-containing protein [Planoprotostelium fungivorum]|uniref:Putative nuclear movement domain-containing protein n=1 Tax=Planoprotostelium fungivorum TaxID=1890364 RepID=A0A2P6NA86_9EUKA|nr:putative nuclear movement domain-containing protein [Planoprotostelium fungivorum]